MDILELLIKRTKYMNGAGIKDDWIDEVVAARTDEIAIILTENALNRFKYNRESIIALREFYNLKAMFDMKNPYANTNMNFYLFVFSKEKNDSILYGIYKDALPSKHIRSKDVVLREEFPESYFSYIEDVERYIETGICPKDTEKYEFGRVDSKIRTENDWNPNRYSKTAMRIRSLLNKEKTVTLSDVATIIRPTPDADKKHTSYYVMPGMWSYPVDKRKLKEGILTDCVLQKGDIVFLNKERMFLVYDNFDQEMHTSPNCYVIRPTKICPEYLYLYLNSETAQLVLASESSGNIICRISSRDLANFPVVIPEREDDYYKSIFYAKEFPSKEILQLNKLIRGDFGESECVEDVLDLELISNLKVHKEEVKERILEEDMREINICFRNKAYKATLVLAGSILEAVLIDWLSEINGKNYFEEEYYDYQGKRGSLAIYIRDIKYLKKPKWIDEAEKAYTIKEKRNQVHAKLCLKSDKIDETVCREVIGYLSDVLRTRNDRERLINVAEINK